MGLRPYTPPLLRQLSEVPELVFEEWGRMYGGSRYENIGYPSISTIATLIEHRGFRPDSQIAKLCVRIDSISDEVESIVMRLQRQGIDGEAEAHCLRVAYDPDKHKESIRIARIRSLGRMIVNPIMSNIARSGYYRRLKSAKEFVSGEYRSRARL